MTPLRILTRSALLLALLTGTALAQDAPTDPVMASLKGLHGITATNLMRTAEMLDEDLYAYRPTEEVRTVGGLLAHVANRFATGLVCFRCVMAS